MKWIDTHSHLYAQHFEGDRAAVLLRCRAVLSHVFLPNIDLESIPQMHALQAHAPDLFYPMMGLHPCSAEGDWRTVLNTMEKALGTQQYYGIGETGLDYYWDKTWVAEQKLALAVQIEWAKDSGLPLILHCRDSMEDVIGMVRAAQDGRLKGIFHCFTGTADQARQVCDLGFMTGIGGVITYKNGGLAEVVPAIPADCLVLETDSPYLPPVPHRGKRNESAYVVHVGDKLAEVLGRSAADVAALTTANALRLFGLPALSSTL